MPRITRALFAAAALSLIAPVGAVAASEPAVAPAEGIIRRQSANGFDETVARVKADVQAKGIRFFDQIDQTALGAQADIKIGRSTLLLFGNPPLGVQFLKSNPYAGLDWPVRMLVLQEPDGSVWVAWNDFDAIAARYRIANRATQFKMASEVAASVATAATSR